MLKLKMKTPSREDKDRPIHTMESIIFADLVQGKARIHGRITVMAQQKTYIRIDIKTGQSMVTLPP